MADLRAQRTGRDHASYISHKLDEFAPHRPTTVTVLRDGQHWWKRSPAAMAPSVTDTAWIIERMVGREMSGPLFAPHDRHRR